MVRALLALAALFSLSFAHASDVVHLDTKPSIDRWGLEVGFGQASYMEDVGRLSILTPFVFGSEERGTGWRVTLDLVSKELQTPVSESWGEYSLSLEQNGKIYKDLAYSYVRFGVGLATPDDDLYDGKIFIVPIALGAQIITQHTNMTLLSFFFEYRFTAFADYDKKKSLPGTGAYISEDTMFPSVVSIGFRLLF